MRKYLALLKVNFSAALTKRGDVIGTMLSNLVTMFATLVLWVAIYNPKQAINGYTLEDTVIYYIFILLITFATATNTVDYLSKSIKQGTLSEWLLKPRDIWWSEFARSLGEQLNRIMALLPLYVIVLLVSWLLPLGIKFSLVGIVATSVFVFLGFSLNCLFEYTLSLLAFWFDEVWSFKHFKTVITDLVGGKRFPVAFFPLIVQNVLKWLPFQFFYFVPMEYLLGKRTLVADLGQDLVVILGWFVILYVFSSILYKKGVKRYAAFGN